MNEATARAIRQRLKSAAVINGGDKGSQMDNLLECEFAIKEMKSRMLSQELQIWLERAELVCEALLNRMRGHMKINKTVDINDARKVLISRLFFNSNNVDCIGEEEEDGNKDLRAAMKSSRAHVLMKQGWLRPAATIWSTLPDAASQANCGVAFGREGNHLKALQCFTKALGLQSDGTIPKETILLLNTARSKFALHSKPELVLELYSLALECAREKPHIEACRIAQSRILMMESAAAAFKALGDSSSKAISLQRCYIFLRQYKPSTHHALGGFTREYFCSLFHSFPGDLQVALCYSEALRIVFTDLESSYSILRTAVLPITLSILENDPLHPFALRIYQHLKNQRIT